MKQVSAFFLLFILAVSCRPDYVAKPDGHFRIEPLDDNYVKTSLLLPFTFEIPASSRLTYDSLQNGYSGFTVEYPTYRATIYCSYIPIDTHTLSRVGAESRQLVFRQARKAEQISATAYTAPERNVYATLYTLSGDNASPIQFEVTDSLRHFLRGALYYNCRPNADSLAPVNKYISDDISHIIETLHWKP